MVRRAIQGGLLTEVEPFETVVQEQGYLPEDGNIQMQLRFIEGEDRDIQLMCRDGDTVIATGMVERDPLQGIVPSEIWEWVNSSETVGNGTSIPFQVLPKTAIRVRRETPREGTSKATFTLKRKAKGHEGIHVSYECETPISQADLEASLLCCDRVVRKKRRQVTFSIPENVATFQLAIDTVINPSERVADDELDYHFVDNGERRAYQIEVEAKNPAAGHALMEEGIMCVSDALGLTPEERDEFTRVYTTVNDRSTFKLYHAANVL